MLRHAAFMFAVLLAGLGTAEATEATKLWTLSKGLDTPESAAYDAASGRIYVSNIAGQAGEKDGKGWITSVKPDGAIEHERFIDGLNAPKGIGFSGGTLWVADIGEVVAIDLKTRTIVQRIPVGSETSFLNDVSVGSDGTVYVSDMTLGKIYAIKEGKWTTALEGVDLVELPNGIFAQGGKLVVASWGKDMQADFSTKVQGSLFAVDLASKARTTLAPKVGNLDGLIARRDGSWILSDWKAGKVLSWSEQDKTVKELITGLQGAADIGYLSETDVVFVPEMGKNALHAYQLSASPRG